MKRNRWLLRCYAEKKGKQWQAFCIDLCLAAQADTFAQAKKKLEAMIREYLHDALVGEDREFAEQLLDRRAPLKQRITYWKLRALSLVGIASENLARAFSEAVPYRPEKPHAV